MTVEKIENVLELRCKDLHNLVKEFTNMYGINDEKTIKARAKWIALENLYNELFGKEVNY